MSTLLNLIKLAQPKRRYDDRKNNRMACLPTADSTKLTAPRQPVTQDRSLSDSRKRHDTLLGSLSDHQTLTFPFPYLTLLTLPEKSTVQGPPLFAFHYIHRALFNSLLDSRTTCSPVPYCTLVTLPQKNAAQDPTLFSPTRSIADPRNKATDNFSEGSINDAVEHLSLTN